MRQHETTPEPSPFVCRTCHKRFKVKGKLEQHQILHSGTTILYQKEAAVSLLSYHINTQTFLAQLHVPIHVVDPFLFICGEKFMCSLHIFSSVVSNILGKTCWDTEVTVFLTGQKNHHCPICDKAFALDVYLKSHLKTHKKQGGYIQCPKCPRRFASEETLQVVQKFKEYEIQQTSLICAGA